MTLREKILLIRQAIINAAFTERSELRIRKALMLDIKTHLAKQRFEDLAYHCNQSGINCCDDARTEKIIVSLTTHSKRILSVHRTIESIFQQSYQANKVVLYLGAQDFQQESQLPIVLQRQINRGLEVRFVPDQGPYTKLLPALREFPDDAIITIDDDILYPVNAIERLVNAHLSKQDAICSLEARMIVKQQDGTIAPYNDFPFPHDPIDLVSTMYVPEGFGGVLYPPHCFSDRVHDSTLFNKLAPKADDLWFKAMSLLDRIPVLKVHDFFEFNHDRYIDQDTQDIGLCNYNYDESGNDRQLKALFDYFNLYDLLKE